MKDKNERKNSAEIGICWWCLPKHYEYFKMERLSAITAETAMGSTRTLGLQLRVAFHQKTCL